MGDKLAAALHGQTELERINVQLATLDVRQAAGYPLKHLAHEAAQQARDERQAIINSLPVGTIIRQVRGDQRPITYEHGSFGWQAVGEPRRVDGYELRHWPTTIIWLGEE